MSREAGPNPEQERHERFVALRDALMGGLHRLYEQAENLRQAIGSETLPPDHPDVPQFWTDVLTAYRSAHTALEEKRGVIDQPMYDELELYCEDIRCDLEDIFGKKISEQLEG